MDLYNFLLYPFIFTEVAFNVFLTINDFLFKIQDEDLHTIFSRFGTVSSWVILKFDLLTHLIISYCILYTLFSPKIFDDRAEIIRDHKTGDSLCYAFIGQYVCPQSVLNLCNFKFIQEFIIFNCLNYSDFFVIKWPFRLISENLHLSSFKRN
jgi:hypothetical protein